MSSPTNAALLAEETKLITEIASHDTAYYVYGQSTITDSDYDVMLRRLAEIEQILGRAQAHSPTQRVGSDLSGSFQKVQHTSPMLSLQNVFSPSEVQAFFGEDTRDLAIVEAKVDGLALELRYRGGILGQAVTRGNGVEGDDVTANVRAIRAIPLSIDHTAPLDVRGEIYLQRSAFKALNEERAAAGEELFANPRNAAAGSLKLKSPGEVSRRNLSFVAYWSTLPLDFTQHEMAAELARLGFPTLLIAPLQAMSESAEDTGDGTPLLFTCHLGDEAEMANAIDNIKNQRADLDLDTDGAVFKINSRARQQELGNRTKSPRWACAFKFPAERQATELLNIEITVGRTGQITPNARLRPVAISGTTVENASLMNADELERIGSPAIGDIVWVEKSAEIIPRITGVKERRGVQAPWVFPGGCPDCGCSLDRKGVHWFCPNPACEERVFQRVKHATSKVALDWDGMGEAQVRFLVHQGQERLQRGLLLSDLFTLDPNALGFKPAALKKFLVERERVKTVPLWRKLVSLGIEDVGQTLSKELAARYGSLDAIIDATVHYSDLARLDRKAAEAAPDTIRSIMGPVALNNLTAYLQEQIDEIELLISVGFAFVDASFGAAARPLSGKIFAITGTLMSGTRDAVSARIEAAGGTVKGTVGKKTSYLVTGEQPGAEKTSAADKYGVPQISEDKLYELLGIPMPSAELPNLDEI